MRETRNSSPLGEGIRVVGKRKKKKKKKKRKGKRNGPSSFGVWHFDSLHQPSRISR
jgi:hypothetical protein